MTKYHNEPCVVFNYGNYRLQPAPLFSDATTILRTPDGSGYGIIHNLSVNGTILLTGLEVASGIAGVVQEIDTFKKAFNRDGRLLNVYVTSDEYAAPDPTNSTGILSGHPIINSYSIEPRTDNYVRGADFTIDMDMITWRDFTNEGVDGTFFGDSYNNNSGSQKEFVQCPPFIETFTENWDVQMDEDRLPLRFASGEGADYASGGGFVEILPFYATVTHQVDVTARVVYTGWDSSTDETYKNDPIADALKWATGVLLNLDDDNAANAQRTRRYGFLSGILQLDNVNALTGAGYGNMIKNHYRQVGIDRSNNAVSITETFIVAPKPSDGNTTLNCAREDFNTNVSESNGVYTFNIAGSIKGWDENEYYRRSGLTWGFEGPGSYGDAVNARPDRWDNAKTYFADVESKFRDRLRVVKESVPSGEGVCLSPIPAIPQAPTQRNVGFNPAAGTIDYDYTYEVFPTFLNCEAITGFCILSQQVRIEDTDHTDVFASQVIPGRALGPVLQDIGTVTAKSRTISIEIVTPPATSLADNASMYEKVPTGCVEELIGVLTGGLSPTPDQIFITQDQTSFGPSDGTYARTFAVTYSTCTSS
ncbi:MAG: hypothetical protein ACYS8Y_07185 [Planctomycetota bacterium]|jgi:hypothetical protein